MQNKKIILIICDGMGDLPIAEFGNKTPLEAANTPHMDFLSKNGTNGIMHVLGKGIRPNSDEAHLTLFGYNLETDYPGRGPIETAGVGFELEEGDIAIRANLATVDDELKVLDRRCGRIEDTSPLINELDGMEIDGVQFLLKAGTGHRVALVMRGKGLSDQITNSDVHYVTEDKVVEDWLNLPVNIIQPMNDSAEAKFTAEVLEKFLKKANEILEKNPVNKERKESGLPKGNYLLTRGPGYFKKLVGFKEKYNLNACCIAGAGLYKGLGVMAGMKLIDVPGATGMPNTNVRAKIEAAMEQIKNFDFVFVHIKPTDIFGENGDTVGKKDFIEKIDLALFGIENSGAEIVITADHSTPCSHKDHSIDPVPFLIYGSNLPIDSVEHFNEKECVNGDGGEIIGKDFMRIIRSASLTN